MRVFQYKSWHVIKPGTPERNNRNGRNDQNNDRNDRNIDRNDQNKDRNDRNNVQKNETPPNCAPYREPIRKPQFLIFC